MLCPKCGVEVTEGSKVCQKCGSILAPEAPKPPGTGYRQEPDMDGLYCYIFGWVTGLLFMLMEKENRCVRFHAMQSIVTFGTATALLIVFNVLGGLRYVGVLFEVLYWLTIALAVVLWLILMVKSYQGKRVRLPIAGNFAEKHI